MNSDCWALCPYILIWVWRYLRAASLWLDVLEPEALLALFVSAEFASSLLRIRTKKYYRSTNQRWTQYSEVVGFKRCSMGGAGAVEWPDSTPHCAVLHLEASSWCCGLLTGFVDACESVRFARRHDLERLVVNCLLFVYYETVLKLRSKVYDYSCILLV